MSHILKTKRIMSKRKTIDAFFKRKDVSTSEIRTSELYLVNFCYNSAPPSVQSWLRPWPCTSFQPTLLLVCLPYSKTRFPIMPFELPEAKSAKPSLKSTKVHFKPQHHNILKGCWRSRLVNSSPTPPWVEKVLFGWSYHEWSLAF